MVTREKLAILIHEQWSSWMKYLFDKCIFNDDGTATIPSWAVIRWQRQIATSYEDLSSNEQQSDLLEADKNLEICIKRLQAYALSLEISQHIGLPDPLTVIDVAIKRLGEI